MDPDGSRWIQMDPEGGNTIPPLEKKEKRGVGSRDPRNSRSPKRAMAKAWVFTWNNYPENYRDILERTKSVCAEWSWGEEVAPTTGTKHIQGYLEAKKKLRFHQFGLPNCVHFEIARGARSKNAAYTQKGENIDASEGMEAREPVRVIETLRPWQEEIIKLLKARPDDRTILWIWEEVGKIGKSALTKLLVVNHKAIVCAGKAADMKYQIAQCKIPPKIVIFDVPRSNLDYLSYTGMEEIKNGCFATSKYESGMVTMNCPHVLIFANAPPERHKLSEDRWKIGKIVEDCIQWEQ